MEAQQRKDSNVQHKAVEQAQKQMRKFAFMTKNKLEVPIKNAQQIRAPKHYDAIGNELRQRLDENLQATEELKCRVAMVCVSPHLHTSPADAQTVVAVTQKAEVGNPKKDTIVATSVVKALATFDTE